jgi:hypothetical protein
VIWSQPLFWRYTACSEGTCGAHGLIDRRQSIERSGLRCHTALAFTGRDPR